MKSFQAHCTVKDGALEWKNVQYLKHGLQQLEGLQGVLTIKKKWNKRSLNQNSLYWSWVSIIAAELGYTDNEAHTVLKGLFAPKKEMKFGTKVYRVPRSTTELTKGEMVSYMFDVEVQANQLGITLPHPEDI